MKPLKNCNCVLECPWIFSPKNSTNRFIKWVIVVRREHYKLVVCRWLFLKHSRPQSSRSFLSAPRITTSGRVQKSVIHRLPVTLRMLRVKSDKSWLVLVSIYCVYKAIQNRNLTGPIQSSLFLVLTKSNAASGDENAFKEATLRFEHLEKFRLNFSSSLHEFVIRVNLLHP